MKREEKRGKKLQWHMVVAVGGTRRTKAFSTRVGIIEKAAEMFY